MSGRGAALAIAVEGASGARRLSLQTGSPAEELWGSPVREAEVNAVHSVLRQALTDIHDVAGNRLDIPAEKAAKPVQRLVLAAHRVAYGLFRGRHLPQLFDAARLHAPAAMNPAVPPRIVEISTPADFGYPFELLPWHYVAEPPDEPAVACRVLLGMSAIVRRRILHSDHVVQPDPLMNLPRLPITLLRHPGLAGATGEVEFFRRAEKVVEAYGPWPGTAPLAESAASRHLMDSRYPLGEAEREAAASVVIHVACHCETASRDTDRHALKLGRGPHDKVVLGELKTTASLHAASLPPPPGPLVFLNACGSAVPPFASRTSFAEFLLDQDAVGVVGTLCDISDEVAAHFAAVFYESLLRGRSVGEAMYDARWHLMDRHGNPLGLLYTYYGDPDLKVAHPRAGRVPPACTLARPVR